MIRLIISNVKIVRAKVARIPPNLRDDRALGLEVMGSKGGLVDRSDFSLQGRWMKIDSCPRTYDGLLLVAIFMPIFLESIVFSSYFFEICNAEMSDMCLGSDPQPYE